MDSIFTPEALDKALHQTLPDLPVDEGHIGAVAQNGEVGVEGSISKELGKGTFVEGDGSWFTRTGYKVAVLIGWKKKP